MDTYISKGAPLPLPPAGAAEHLVGYLMEAGPVMHGGMGAVPLSWLEITAWQANTGIALEAWEARTLRHLSGVYVTACREAEAMDAPAPWLPERDTTPEANAKLARDIRAALRGH